MNEPLGLLIVGCGYWGVNYVRNFMEIPETRVVAICDQRAERLRELRRRFPEPALTTDLQKALRVRGVDAVVVCTNAASHYEVARQCLEAGKHVLVEKPMATSTRDAQHLVELAELKRVTLMVGHIFLYNNAVRKIKSLIDDRSLGELYYLYARRTNLGPIRCDVNALWDLAPHDVSIFNYLLGTRPAWVSAVGTPVLHNCREDVGFIVLGYPNNLLGHVHVSWADPLKVREVVVVGSDKRVVFNDLDPLERVRIYEKGIAPTPDETEPASFSEHQFSIRDGDIISPKIEFSEPLKSQCRHFVECVFEGCPPLSDGREGLDVVRVMEAIARSVSLRGAPVEIGWDQVKDNLARVGTEGNYDHRTSVGAVR